jgi:hypothetical protein
VKPIYYHLNYPTSEMFRAEVFGEWVINLNGTLKKQVVENCVKWNIISFTLT